MKKWMRGTLAAIAVLLFNGMTVCAAEELKQNMVMETIEEVKLLEAPEKRAEEVIALPAGAAVVLTEDEVKGWCKVSAQETEGYLQTSQLKTLGNAEELNSEFDKISNTVQLIFDEIIVRENETKQSRIWGTVIVVLIAAIFGVGIVSAVKKNKEEEKKKL